MTWHGTARGDDFDRRMRDWMALDARVGEPEGLADAVIARTRQARRIPGWLLPERWIPMQLTMRFQAVPRLAPVPLLLIALLLVSVLLVIGLGAPKPLPAPFGPARNGLIVYDAKGVIYGADPKAGPSSARPLVTTVPNAAAVTMSADGARMAFWGDGSPDSLYVADADGTNVHKVIGDLWIGTDKPPTWSPDGRHLAYSSESAPDALDEQIYVVDATAGSKPIAVTGPGNVRSIYPAWSPDGSLLAYQAVSASGAPLGLWVARADGTGQTRVKTNGTAETAHPQWAPSSSPLRLAYAAQGRISGAWDIFVFDVTNGTETQISSDPAEDHWPVWSPDGTKLAWLVFVIRPNELRIAPVDHPDQAFSILSGFMSDQPAWSPDSTKVFGAADNDTISIVTIDGSAPITHIAHLRGQGLPDWQRLAP